jgi:hypothetical protein
MLTNLNQALQEIKLLKDVKCDDDPVSKFKQMV